MPPYSIEDVKQAYRAKVKTAHPDVGGTAAEFTEIQAAYEQALEYVRFRASRMAWLSSHVEQYAAQQAFVGEIERQGGGAEIEGVDWLKQSFGADFAQLVSRIVGLRCPAGNSATTRSPCCSANVTCSTTCTGWTCRRAARPTGARRFW